MSGIAAGLKKGHIVTRFTDVATGEAKNVTKDRPAYRKGALPKRVKFVREIVQEVMGFAPYEKRIMEVLKLGKEKRAQRFAKKRLGTHQRGVKKRAAMEEALRAMRR